MKSRPQNHLLKLLTSQPKFRAAVNREGPTGRAYAAWAAGQVSHQKKMKRLNELKPRMIEMLQKRYLQVEIAEALGITPMMVSTYVRSDPEMKAIAETYIRKGGDVRRRFS